VGLFSISDDELHAQKMSKASKIEISAIAEAIL